MALTQISTEGIKNGTISTADLADQSITLAKLPHGTSSNDGKFLRANNGADPTFETVNTDLVSDSSPQLGGNLDTNGNNISFLDGNQARFGTGNDMNIFHSADVNQITTGTKVFKIFGGGSNNKTIFATATTNAAELYFDNSKKFETTSIGTAVTGSVVVSGGTNQSPIQSTTSNDYVGKFESSDSHARLIVQDSNSTNNHNGLQVEGDNTLLICANETGVKCAGNGAVELYYDNSKRIETLTEGAKIKRYSGGSTTLFIEGAEGSNAILDMFADDGDDIADRFRLTATSGGTFYMQNYANNGWQSNISFTGAGNVELFHNGSKKFETTSSGVEVFGELQMDDANSHIKIPDNARIDIGNSNDLQIYHNATANTNEFTSPLSTNFRGKNLYFYVGANVSSEQAIMAYANQGVELYYDNTKKFETASAGVDVSGRIQIDGHCFPYSNNAYDLGLSSNRWRNVYTNDLNLSNEGGANDVDGTWGSYTIQEGEESLFLINKRNGKKYKFNLTEVS